ncbi:MAG: SUKH-3 domain-containing protein, partial [Oscillospiraceae bacterium]|nr:SUKH-3 domain-containing protein [Oscillospiraceae bacterium]
SIDIDPFSNYVDDEVFKIYEDYFKVSLIPIGLMRCPDTYLFIGKNGNIYGSFDEYACVLGKDFFQFIGNLIDEKIFFDIINNFYEL